jgi:hypothetical protein
VTNMLAMRSAMRTQEIVNQLGLVQWGRLPGGWETLTTVILKENQGLPGP